MKYLKFLEKVNSENELMKAVKRGSTKTVEYICKKEPSLINKTTSPNKTPLMIAVINEYLMVVKMLIKYEADVNIQNSKGETALMLAKTPKIIDTILSANPDVNLRDHDGNTVILHLTDKLLFFEFIDKLITHGLDINIKNNYGYNIYDILKNHTENLMSFVEKKSYYESVIEYLGKKFPHLKEEWELNDAVRKYNL